MLLILNKLDIQRPIF